MNPVVYQDRHGDLWVAVNNRYHFVADTCGSTQEWVLKLFGPLQKVSDTDVVTTR